MAGLMPIEPVVRLHTEAGAKVNEDAVAAAGAMVALADGATSLVGAHITDAPSDPHWFAHALVEELARRSALEIPRALEGAIEAVRDSATGRRFAGRAAEEIPIASLVLATWDEKRVVIAALGDCTAIIRQGLPASSSTGGTPADFDVRTVHNSTVSQLDAGAVAAMVDAARRTGKTVRECRDAVDQILADNRAKSLTHPAYHPVALDPAVVSQLEYAIFPRSQVYDLLLMSDGYAAAAELGMSDAELAQLAATDIRRPAQKVRSAYDGDPDFLRYPRLKHCDDMTAAYIRLADIC